MLVMVAEALRKQVEDWIADDPDPKTQAELRALLDSGSEDELQDRFRGLLKFGTAGLRGLLGGGPNRMNRSVVIRATAGLCDHLLATVPDAAERGVVIGFDGRRQSRELAQDVAEVVLAAGLRAKVFQEVAPTPLVGFAVLDQRAAAGVVITASHNPPDYNGYKVYWANGAQIIPPHDAGIANAIAKRDTVRKIERATRDDHPRVEILGDQVRQRYLAGVHRALIKPDAPRDFAIAYTALHGVGGAMAVTALHQAGFSEVNVVAEQHETGRALFLP